MHTVPIQIRFSDIDRLGHVNNSIYNQYLDVARLDYINQTIRKYTDWDSKTVVLVHVECDFLQSTLITDTVYVTTQVLKTGNRSITMSQQIVDDKGSVKVKSLSVLSTLDVKTGESFPLPDEWRMAVEQFRAS